RKIAGAVAVAGAAGMRKMGSRLTNPRADERALMYGITAAGASLVLLLLMIAIRYGSAPDWIPVDINAEGTVLTFGTKAAIWRLPVFALFSSLMALGLAWWLREREPFATQFLAVGAIMINIIVWVGAITLLW
ncbi:MAG TPA: hypothetical protein PK691_04605, partial [Thermomicrobiales bacterium]|nr:hypothetical protein [Thermomicrobiales bacterium]